MPFSREFSISLSESDHMIFTLFSGPNEVRNLSRMWTEDRVPIRIDAARMELV